MDVMTLIQKNKNTVLSIVIVVIALFISLKIYQNQDKEIENLKKKAQAEEKSNQIFGTLVTLDDKINIYKRSLKIKTTSEVMNRVSEIVKESGLKLESIRPLSESLNEDFVRFSVSASLRTKDFNQLGEFMSRLENDPALFTIDSLKINRDSSGSGLSIGLRVSAIRVLD